MWKFLRKILFCLPPETAHGVACFALKGLGVTYLLRSKQKRAPLPARNARFSLAGFPLTSPLGVAAGFDKNGAYVLGLRSLGFGFVEVGSVTPRPQPGNPQPRLFRVPEAKSLINRMGFNSEGAVSVKRRLELVRSQAKLDFPIGINLGKNRDTHLELAVRDYQEALGILYGVSDYLVINLSSPNTPGLTQLQEGEALAGILAGVRESRDTAAKREGGPLRPLFLKLSPDLSNEALLLASQAAMEYGFSGIIAANTSRRRDFPGLAQGPILAEEGGLSGPPLAARAKELLPILRSRLPKETVLISAGGISQVADVEERLSLGANLVQAYTGFIYQGPVLPLSVEKRFRL